MVRITISLAGYARALSPDLVVAEPDAEALGRAVAARVLDVHVVFRHALAEALPMALDHRGADLRAGLFGGGVVAADLLAEDVVRVQHVVLHLVVHHRRITAAGRAPPEVELLAFERRAGQGPDQAVLGLVGSHALAAAGKREE
jgi:hypothetical protein